MSMSKHGVAMHRSKEFTPQGNKGVCPEVTAFDVSSDGRCGTLNAEITGALNEQQCMSMGLRLQFSGWSHRILCCLPHWKGLGCF